MIVSDLIRMALLNSGAVAIPQTIYADDLLAGLDLLNGMIGQWARQRWLVWRLMDKSVVSTGAQSYTIGPGEDFDTPRPDRLESAFLRQIVSAGNNIDFPLRILESREDYNRIALKTLSSWATFIFYDAAFPVGSIYPWPVPAADLFGIHVSVKQPLTQFASVSEDVEMPPEYIEALWTNLTIRLIGLYPNAQVTPRIMAMAASSLAVVRGANTQIPSLVMPRYMARRPLWNIYSGRQY